MIKKRNFEFVVSNFVMGIPGETWEDIRESYRFVDALVDNNLFDYVSFAIATPLPGTELYEECQEKGYLPPEFSFEEFYGFGRGVITTDEFTPNELQTLRAYEWDRINFKTHEKQVKIARMIGITLDELDEWRRETRKSIGLNVGPVDKRNYE